jgi:hypothetical protein
MEDDPTSSDISSSGVQEVSILRWKVYEESNKGMK